MNEKSGINGVFVIVLIAIFFVAGVVLPYGNHNNEHMMDEIALEDMEKHMEIHIVHRDSMFEGLIDTGEYKCCLHHPCNTCLTLDPYHGEGATCTCLEDLVNGEAPCGECLGGILAGRGNPYLAQYFAQSIADEIGEEYIDEARDIVSAKYDISIEEQN